ncbi:neural/ectodermal development factor IMP-L2 isoform X1 [Drosophila tropicalis]|uniref:neural/ectodermal development factor IMP-L2 isoform X1 n=2 Tax=Drosophila tropicalis TaxID=46794 RepID=UPI0035AC1F1E
MQKMNLYLCAIALLLFSCLLGTNGRAVDTVDDSNDDTENDNDVDNSIEAEDKHKGRPFEVDWLKFTNTPPTKMQQSPGTIVEIACEMMGSQVPTIQWIVGHMPLSEIDNLESNRVMESAPSAIVRVRSVHIIDHVLSEPRIYTCIGRTGSKTIYASTVVHPPHTSVGVREKQFAGPQKPRIIYTEKTHLDLVGSNVLLPCKVHSRPRSEIIWENNENNVIKQSHRFKVLPTGELLISDLKWEDMGNYKCIARNAVGRDFADTFVYPVLKEQED